VSQRRIAALTGLSQSEISEIIGGRRVTSYDLVCIAEGSGCAAWLAGSGVPPRAGSRRRGGASRGMGPAGARPLISWLR
jgi:hypothetical protein